MRHVRLIAVALRLEAAKELDTYINDVREGNNDADAPLFTDRSGQALTGNQSASASSG